MLDVWEEYQGISSVGNVVRALAWGKAHGEPCQRKLVVKGG